MRHISSCPGLNDFILKNCDIFIQIFKDYIETQDYINEVYNAYKNFWIVKSKNKLYLIYDDNNERNNLKMYIANFDIESSKYNHMAFDSLIQDEFFENDFLKNELLDLFSNYSKFKIIEEKFL